MSRRALTHVKHLSRTLPPRHAELLAVIAEHADPETDIAELTHKQLMALTGFSQQWIGQLLRQLKAGPNPVLASEVKRAGYPVAITCYHFPRLPTLTTEGPRVIAARDREHIRENARLARAEAQRLKKDIFQRLQAETLATKPVHQAGA